MAVSLAFGVTFATVITLLVVPAIYCTFQDIEDVLAGLRRKPGLETDPAIEQGT